MPGETRLLIAAAGSGSRAGLPYPKTLHPVLGRPILLRLLDLFASIDPRPVVIVSPQGEAPIAAAIAEHGRAAELIVQDSPTGMGDAVLLFERAEGAAQAKQLILVWGDIPLIQEATIRSLIATHQETASDFTFATREVDQAYTVVRRAASGAVESVEETRETGAVPGPGERDIGLFMFRPDKVLPILAERLPGWSGSRTGEHGFLYVIAHLAKRGLKVTAVPTATDLDLISLNRLADLEAVPGR